MLLNLVSQSRSDRRVLTRPSEQYRQDVADAQVRDLDGVIQKLNTTYQQDLKDEMEAENFFLT